jgi:hypothetical protein
MARRTGESRREFDVATIINGGLLIGKYNYNSPPSYSTIKHIYGSIVGISHIEPLLPGYTGSSIPISECNKGIFRNRNGIHGPISVPTKWDIVQGGIIYPGDTAFIPQDLPVHNGVDNGHVGMISTSIIQGKHYIFIRTAIYICIRVREM